MTSSSASLTQACVGSQQEDGLSLPAPASKTPCSLLAPDAQSETTSSRPRAQGVATQRHSKPPIAYRAAPLPGPFFPPRAKPQKIGLTRDDGNTQTMQRQAQDKRAEGYLHMYGGIHFRGGSRRYSITQPHSSENTWNLEFRDNTRAQMQHLSVENQYLSTWYVTLDHTQVLEML